MDQPQDHQVAVVAEVQVAQDPHLAEEDVVNSF